MIKIFPQFTPIRIFLRPRPVFPNFRERIFVDRYGGVDPCARVTIPVPDTAEVFSCLEALDVEA